LPAAPYREERCSCARTTPEPIPRFTTTATPLRRSHEDGVHVGYLATKVKSMRGGLLLRRQARVWLFLKRLDGGHDSRTPRVLDLRSGASGGAHQLSLTRRPCGIQGAVAHRRPTTQARAGTGPSKMLVPTCVVAGECRSPPTRSRQTRTSWPNCGLQVGRARAHVCGRAASRADRFAAEWVGPARPPGARRTDTARRTPGVTRSDPRIDRRSPRPRPHRRTGLAGCEAAPTPQP
jgi:hypothetical protein